MGELSWSLVWRSAMPSLVVTTVYSYVAAGVVGTYTGFRTRGDKVAIRRALDSFIVSPFYVATFFSCLAATLWWRSAAAVQRAPGIPVVHALLVGLLVFVGHLALEVIESTVTHHDPLRMLGDKDALRLAAIELLVVVGTTLSAALA